MLDSVAKAKVLLEALEYIRRFRDKITVIKLGGSVMDDDAALDSLLVDIIFMETVGLRPVVVHGGGAAVTKAMQQAGLEPRFIQGRRVTDDAALEIIGRVLAGDINTRLVDRIEAQGGRAAPLSYHFRSANVLVGEKLILADESGQPIDLGHVGRVTKVDRQTIENLCYANIVPVIPCLCLTASGEKLNVNADTAATAVAAELRAEKFVLITDVNGVRRDKHDPDSLISTLTADEANQLIASGQIESGMIPKVQACLEALANGVHQTHVVDGRQRHSLLLEIYTQSGVGTQIVSGSLR